MDMASFSPRKSFTRRQLLGMAIGSSLLFACSALSAPAHANDQFVSKCHAITPSTTVSNYPGSNKIILSNNLARPTGKAMNAPGQLLYLSGRVTDENCVPVPNAIIDLWHANPFGEYRWAARDELLNPEPIFAGNGRAVTDNLGRYQFTTLFPGAVGSSAPHVNMRVSQPDFGTLNTSMYFRGDRRNSSDSRFKAYKSASQALLLGDVTMRDAKNIDAGLTANYDIVLKGRSDYRQY